MPSVAITSSCPSLAPHLLLLQARIQKFNLRKLEAVCEANELSTIRDGTTGDKPGDKLSRDEMKQKLLKRVRQPGAKPLDLDALPERRVRPTWGARPPG